MAHLQTYNVDVGAAYIEQLARSRLVGPGALAPTASWPLDDCGDGASGNGVTFRDRSGNNRHATGDNGGNDTGLTCRASEFLRRKPWVQ